MRVLSGIQPSGTMHLGNYLGAVKQWVATQNDDAYYCVVDLHALTLPIEPDTLREETLACAASLLAAGLDPTVCTLFLQSHVAYHTRLSWLLECVASYGELTRMTQFKDKSTRQESPRAGLFTYPVLMASDILLYDADRVPVGDDQRQHLELTRNIAERFNHLYGETFQVPEGFLPEVAARVMDLQEPSRKMSKSVSSPMGKITLIDSSDEIDRKIKRAVTDTDNDVRFDWEKKPGLSNLIEIYSSLSGLSTQAVTDQYTQYGPLKNDLAQLVMDELAPIAKRYEEFVNDPAELNRLLALGAERASQVAAATYERAASAMGLLA